MLGQRHTRAKSGPDIVGAGMEPQRIPDPSIRSVLSTKSGTDPSALWERLRYGSY